VSSRRAGAVVLALFFLSGACDLAFEIAWGRALSLVFGVTVFAVSSVVASFLLGLAAGGLAVGRLRAAEERPMVLFGWLHAGIGLTGLVTLLLLPVARAIYVSASESLGAGALHAIACMLTLALLAAPTALMGATFPVASHLVATRPATLARDIGRLYAVGTLGSVFGCVAAVSLLLPGAGLRGTIESASLLDGAIGFAALAMSRLPRGTTSS
jgi:spermidine synthase